MLKSFFVAEKYNRMLNHLGARLIGYSVAKQRCDTSLLEPVMIDGRVYLHGPKMKPRGSFACKSGLTTV